MTGWSCTAEAGAQLGQVLPHHRNIVSSRAGFEPFDRVEDIGLRTDLLRQRFGDLGADQRLEVDRRYALLLGERSDLGQPLRGRLLLRRQPGDRYLAELVPRCEVAEGGVAGDDV